MWDELKKHYQKRVNTFELKGRASEHPCLHAKSVLNVMEHFELKEDSKKNNHVNLSINDIRAMAEDL
jgi:hypothetical protein